MAKANFTMLEVQRAFGSKPRTGQGYEDEFED